MRGMVAWLGLREAFVPFERQPRAAGSTKYPLWKMLRFAWTGITSFSAMPLRLTMGMGLFAVLLAFVYLIYALIQALVLKHTVWGWTSIVFLQCLFFGMTLVCVGLIGDYVARIYEEAKGRPLYVVDRALNLNYPRGVTRMVVLEADDANSLPLSHGKRIRLRQMLWAEAQALTSPSLYPRFVPFCYTLPGVAKGLLRIAHR